jgi:hypothetical protein
VNINQEIIDIRNLLGNASELSVIRTALDDENCLVYAKGREFDYIVEHLMSDAKISMVSRRIGKRLPDSKITRITDKMMGVTLASRRKNSQGG